MDFRAFKDRRNDWHATPNLFWFDHFQGANDHTAIGYKTRLMHLRLTLIHHSTTQVLHHSSSMLKAGCHV